VEDLQQLVAKLESKKLAEGKSSACSPLFHLASCRAWPGEIARIAP
jgi:hypothetical protein